MAPSWADAVSSKSRPPTRSVGKPRKTEPTIAPTAALNACRRVTPSLADVRARSSNWLAIEAVLER